MRETAASDADSDMDAIQDKARLVAAAIADGDMTAAVGLITGMPAPDLANIIELLAADARVRLIEAQGTDFDFEVLSELDPSVRDQLTEALPNELLARAVNALDTDDAAYVIEHLDADDRREILSKLPILDRVALERNLDYPEETAGRLMQADFVAVAPYWTVGYVIDTMRDAPPDDLPETFTEFFVVDPTFKVLGAVAISRLLRAKRHVKIEEIMNNDRAVVLATADQTEVARQFRRYDLMSAPVVDANQRLVGVLTVDDVVEVIDEEAEHEMKAMGGIGDERLSDSVREIAPDRFSWLFINLITAILASSVIKVFDATIENMVALAVLMPIVASMGGNAGTQTMTVAVRALATGELGAANVVRVVLRETTIGLLNGLAFATLMAIVVLLYYGSTVLGGVIAGAMVINLLAAALAGICVPLLLDRWGYDPAVSSTVFVTTVTDVVGFFAFLGLASIWMR